MLKYVRLGKKNGVWLGNMKLTLKGRETHLVPRRDKRTGDLILENRAYQFRVWVERGADGKKHAFVTGQAIFQGKAAPILQEKCLFEPLPNILELRKMVGLEDPTSFPSGWSRIATSRRSR